MRRTLGALLVIAPLLLGSCEDNTADVLRPGSRSDALTNTPPQDGTRDGGSPPEREGPPRDGGDVPRDGGDRGPAGRETGM